MDSEILHVAPTVLAMLGVHVPEDMEGEVVEQFFDPPITFSTEAVSAAADSSESDRAVYSGKEEEELTQRLIDLGYLE